MTGLPSATALRAALTTFRTGTTKAFSIGEGVPEAVVLTYDEFEDLNGEAKFVVASQVLDLSTLADELPALLPTLRSGEAPAILFGEAAEPEAVLLSTTNYRTLRGDDQPPPGVIDDPTQRTYASEPLPTSKPFDLDEFAEGDPFTQELLREIRAERDDSR